MKILFYFLIIIILLVSCKKENELEGLSIDNPFDLVLVDYITVDKIESQRCDVVMMDLSINSENLPPNLTFTHILIKIEDGPGHKTRRLSGIFTESNCNQTTVYYFTLYDENLNRESLPTKYTFN